MAWTLISKNVEVASGVILSMPFYYDGTNYYPATQEVPGEAGGLSVYSFAPAAATTNATSIKATPGMVYGYHLFSINTDIAYLAFYDKASAPTPGTDAIKFIDGIADSSTTTGQRTSAFFPQGIVFSTGIACAIFEVMPTGTATALDTAPTVIAAIYYK
jgi:hypothetical protein